MAKQKQPPRDVVSDLKEDKRRHPSKEFQGYPTDRGETIKVLKELPKKVIQSRKEYHPLTEILKKQDIRYRWKIPEGLSFKAKGKKYIVTDSETLLEVVSELDGEFKSN